ncbi:hypothetical protein GF1_11740 [Desulfolithobacter dissulfuricans]|uniref:Uncharacterized protein n=1 Tax=Desulfolithobacter dissulfuricans TaxID=2795293 RepID=A0A915TZI5_9BACT|nr:hypothetical protein [Desulfolithobacter dissulfuricans]BCO08798.1 hypothetical protein GF1_11740 [Desulfolithobacter dissulfuricans]
MKCFTWKQHDRAGHGLQVLYNQSLMVSDAIHRGYPRKNKLCLMTTKVQRAVLALREILENQAMTDFQNDRDRAGKLYFRSGQPDFSCPELLVGVPGMLAREFQHIQERRKMAGTKRKTGLTQAEAQALVIALDHWQQRVVLLQIDLLDSYGAGSKAVSAADTLLRTIQDLSKILSIIHPYCMEKLHER